MIKDTVKKLKQIGELCAVEALVSLTFWVAFILCLFAEVYDGAAVAIFIALGAALLGRMRYRKLTSRKGSTGIGATEYKTDGGPLTFAAAKRKGIAPLKKRARKPAKSKPRKTKLKKSKGRK